MRFALLLTILAIYQGLITRSSAAREGGSPAQGEHIILSGGVALLSWERFRVRPDQHDRWWGTFIRSARFRVQELQEKYGPNARITWLVYKDSYQRRSAEDGKPYIRWIKSVEEKYKIKLVWIRTGRDVLNYLNRGQNRRAIKIASFDYYGHSNRHAFMFDYSNHILGASKAYLHENDLKGLRRGLFTNGALIKSWGCHTAESMGKYWKAATGTPMWGAVGKTNYEKISTLKKPQLSPGAYWRL